ncbi:MAG: recombinase family protein [Eubacterium sp.]|nr:recombinase family protein [Eubacterium sp.]
MGQLLGYARVSTLEQNLDRQLDALKDYGVDERLIYREKITGTKRERPELSRMLDEMQKGDTVVICDLTRISRSTKDMLDIVEKIKNKGAFIKSLKDTWLDTTSGNPYSQFLLVIMSGLAQLERDLISQRTKEGLKAAKARGRNGGRPSLQNKHRDAVMAMYRGGMKISDIVIETKISRSTVKRIIKNNTPGLIQCIQQGEGMS